MKKYSKLALLWQQFNTQFPGELKAIRRSYVDAIERAAAAELPALLLRLQLELVLTGNYTLFDGCSPEGVILNLACIHTQKAISGLPAEVHSELAVLMKSLRGEVNFDAGVMDCVKAIGRAFESNPEQLRANMLDCVNSHFDTMHGMLKNDKIFGDHNKCLVFGTQIGIAFGKGMYIHSPHAIHAIDEAALAMKQAISEVVRETDRLSPETKEKLLLKINRIPVNGKSNPDDNTLNDVDGLADLQLGGSFWENANNLRRIQREKIESQHMNLSEIMAKDSSRRKAAYGNSAACFNDTEYSTVTLPLYSGNSTHIPREVYEAVRLAQTPAFREHLGMSESEFLKYLLYPIIGHEMGHALDTYLGTLANSNPEFAPLSPEEREGILKLKADLARHSESKGKELTPSWTPTTKYTVDAEDEIFADFIGFNAVYKALCKAYPAERAGQLAPIFITLGFRDDEHTKDLSQYDEATDHPPFCIRFDSTVGLYQWIYESGLNIEESDLLYTAPEERLKF
jgi:hypothetical protein